ncbi:unnamed protein product [Urochloa humidicola]
MDYVVRSCIVGTISNVLADAVLEPNNIACTAWLAVETQFLGNHETRALFLDPKFWAFSQGDVSITDYCKTYNKMVRELRALGEDVQDRTLVMNVIRGLNECYRDFSIHLHRSKPFPSLACGTTCYWRS